MAQFQLSLRDCLYPPVLEKRLLFRLARRPALAVAALLLELLH